jgi:hypothetical protein
VGSGNRPTRTVASASRHIYIMANPHSWATFNELFADHAMFASQWPKIMDGYAGPNALEPALVEAAMVAVNSVKDCSF